jgi:hypothetical protein
MVSHKPSPGVVESNSQRLLEELPRPLRRGGAPVGLRTNGTSSERVRAVWNPASPVGPALISHLHNAHFSLSLDNSGGACSWGYFDRSHVATQTEHVQERMRPIRFAHSRSTAAWWGRMVIKLRWSTPSSLPAVLFPSHFPVSRLPALSSVPALFFTPCEFSPSSQSWLPSPPPSRVQCLPSVISLPRASRAPSKK